MKNTTSNSYVGSTFTIPAGTRVNRNGLALTQQRTLNVTVRSQELTRNGKTRIYWKSLGLRAFVTLA